MTSLGEIVLKFGASGADGEAPLRFVSGHINLLVGPNNAGKSLMLRELSGLNPRARPRRGWEDVEYAPTRIVEAVHWSAEVAQALQQQVVASVFAESAFSSCQSAWDELRTRTWDQLLPALEEAAPQLEAARDRLFTSLLTLSTGLMGEWGEYVAVFLQSDRKASSPVVIGLAVVLLLVTDMGPIVVEEGAAGPETAAVRRAGPLTPEQSAAVREALESARSTCAPILTRLGVDTTELTVARLLDPNAFGGALLDELGKDPILGRLITKDPRLASRSKATAAEVQQVRRLLDYGGLVLDPTPLIQVASRLREGYAAETWADPSRRAHDAEGALFLDGMARLNVTRPAKLNAFGKVDGEQPAILALLKDPEQMGLLRELTADALGGYLVLDMTSEAPQVVWRVAREEPPEGIETAYTEATEQFNKSATRLDERSDGIHAFVGMLAAILAMRTDRVFIDEPEAFLHPPLIRQLARTLGMLARQGEMQFFIATHSADLLEAAVACGAEVNIVRLTHDAERSTARLLNSADLRHLARDPLLRSESTLSALFHEGAVICEAAGDRVLYKEIHERLLVDDEEALDSCVFLNAQNWSTVPRMMAPLRRMGVAAAAVLDADVLFEQGLTLVLDAAQVDKDLRDGWLKQRDGLRDRIAERLGLIGKPVEATPETGRKKKKLREQEELKFKRELIATLTAGEQKIFKALRRSMAEYGVFIVPVGELEDWLAPLGCKPPKDEKSKGKWLREALDRLGQDPQSEAYVRPDKGDIWDFMRAINAWILDPDREGTSLTTRGASPGPTPARERP